MHDHLPLTVPDGFAARPAHADDIDDVVAVIAAGELAANGEVDVTVEDVLSDWNQPSFDLRNDAVVVTSESRVVGYAQHHRGRALAWVHPDVTGRGIGAALLDWTEARARATGDGEVGQTLSENQQAARALLQAHGYAVRWDSWIFQRSVVGDLPTLPMPAGLRMRPLWRPDDERAVYELIETAFSAWPGRPRVGFDDWVAQHLNRDDTTPDLRLVAESENGDLVGAALCLVYDDEGWVAELAVDEARRGQGIGQALLGAAFSAFRAKGLQKAGLNTDSRTGARALYERVGMRIVRSYARFGKTLYREADEGPAARLT